MGKDCKREMKGENWDEINIEPNDWGKTVRERREEITGAR